VVVIVTTPLDDPPTNARKIIANAIKPNAPAPAQIHVRRSPDLSESTQVSVPTAVLANGDGAPSDSVRATNGFGGGGNGEGRPPVSVVPAGIPLPFDGMNAEVDPLS
jgi:hypothetical protein